MSDKPEATTEEKYDPFPCMGCGEPVELSAEAGETYEVFSGATFIILCDKCGDKFGEPI